MFELIGMLVVAWFLFVVVKGYFSAKSRVRSMGIGQEMRAIAISELGVPVAYYNYAVLHHMDEIKKAALVLKERSDGYESLSWPRQMAWAVYNGYRFDCVQYESGNPLSAGLFEDLSISSGTILSELKRGPKVVSVKRRFVSIQPVNKTNKRVRTSHFSSSQDSKAENKTKLKCQGCSSEVGVSYDDSHVALCRRCKVAKSTRFTQGH